MRTKYVTWSELRVGILVLLSVIILTIVIVILGQKANLFTRKYTLRTHLNRVEGLTVGAPVWLAGVEVGNVKEIKFIPLSEGGKIEVVFTVNRDVMELIRQDSIAIITSKGLLGDKIIYLTVGSKDKEVVPPDGILPSEEFTDFGVVLNKLSTALSRLSDLSDRIDAVAVELHNITTRANAVINRIDAGKGTLGRLISDDEIYNNLKTAVTSLNTVLMELNSPKGTLGMLLKDPTFYEKLNSTASRMNSFMEKIDKGEGTLGRLASDEKLYSDLMEATNSLKELIADIKKNPNKYLTIKVF
jgi:phospholipid/cholesterol/gamma-HCH transport system substrate-binding protein